MAARLLAARINAALVEHPRILHKAQRDFIRNGAVSQCIAALLDARDDSAEHGTPLFWLSYDLAKAYDSVQHYACVAGALQHARPFYQLCHVQRDGRMQCVENASRNIIAISFTYFGSARRPFIT